MNFGNFISEVGLRSGQKAAANVGAKIGTSLASAYVGHKIIQHVNKKDKPLNDYKSKKKREKHATKRVIRDSLIGSSVTLIGVAANMAISKGIEASD